MGTTLLASGLTALLCYLFGSFNLAVIVSRRKFGRDVRACGSGNAGSTNMLRTFGWKAAIPVFLGDMAKGALAVGIGGALFSSFGLARLSGSYLGGAFALIGQMYPLYFAFHGGKGVATALGVIIALHPVGGPILLACGLGIAAASGYVSAGSVLGTLAYPILAVCTGGWDELFPSLVIAGLILYGHRENIRRLLEHRENKFTPPPSK